AHVRMPGFTYTISQDRRPLASPKLCATNVFQTRLFSPHVTDGTTTCQSHIGKSAYKERRSLPRDPPARVWLRRSASGRMRHGKEKCLEKLLDQLPRCPWCAPGLIQP